MVAVVEDCFADAVDGLIEAPSQGFVGDVPPVFAVADDGLHAHGDGFADDAFVEELFGSGHGFVVCEVLEDAEELAGSIGGFDDGVAFVEGDGHRLLEGDVFVGVEGVDDHLGVEGVGGEDLYGVDFGVVEHRSVVGVGFFSAPLCGTGFGDAGAVVGDRVDAGVGVGDVAGCVEVGNLAGADESYV